MPELKEVILSVTNRCNAQCRMCDIPGQKTEELPFSKWEEVIKDAFALGAQTVVFSGGEPLLREDIFELISCVKINHMRVCITSNGYFLTDGVAGRLAGSGVDVVNISVEGPKDIHDYLRGANSFDKAVAALENLKKHKIESTIATVISRYNYRYLTHVAELARKYGVTTIKFQPFSEIFLNRSKKIKDFLFHSNDKEGLSSEINRVAKLCDEYCITTNPRGYLERIPLYVTEKKNKMHSVCAAIFISCPIDSAGTVYPCWVITDRNRLIGNIKEERLLNVWNSQRRNSIIERINKKGCPGCMMSCYDDNFGKEGIEIRIAANINRLRKKGFCEYSRFMFRKWEKRIKFYLAYRGSLKTLIVRVRKLFVKRNPMYGLINQEEVRKALEETREIKCIIQEEIRKST